MSNNLKYWLAFAALEKSSSIFVQKLFEHFLDIELAWKSDLSELVSVANITKKQLDNFITERKKIEPDRCLDYILNKGCSVLTFDSPEYPSMLRHIYNPPMTLFIEGNIERCNLLRTLAVVGSRKASQNSKEVLSKIINQFSNTDVCIVSGLASGIDTVAHSAAISSNLTTIAVLGGGLNHVYPASNKSLYSKIKDGNGAVISEYWPTFEPITWRFPHRNRIVSGLSYGTLVAEAALKSGALITAKLALEHGRELMCIPGLISNPNTEGIYKLLKEGASLVTSASDILSCLNWEIKSNPVILSNNVPGHAIESSEESSILSIVQKDSVSIDYLLSKTGLNIGDLMVILTKLEIRGLIKQVEGDKYMSLAVF